MPIECELDETLVEHKGKDVPGLILICGECDHCVSCPGYDTRENRQHLIDEIERTCPERLRQRHMIVDMVE